MKFETVFCDRCYADITNENCDNTFSMHLVSISAAKSSAEEHILVKGLICRSCAEGIKNQYKNVVGKGG